MKKAIVVIAAAALGFAAYSMSPAPAQCQAGCFAAQCLTGASCMPGCACVGAEPGKWGTCMSIDFLEGGQ